MCIQPRRISAVSVAERVAAERGEAVGDTVGYNIRLESAGGAHSSLVFCTNGVLLRMLTQGDGLQVRPPRIYKYKFMYRIHSRASLPPSPVHPM